MFPMRIDYVILYVEDPEATAAFYRRVLGMDVRVRGDGYLELDAEGTKLGLLDRARLPDLIGRPGGAPGPTSEVAFVVDDVDGEHARLRELGVEILSGPQDRPWGHRTLHLLDPDGHVVELAQEIPRDAT